MTTPAAPAKATPENPRTQANLQILGRLAEVGLDIAMALERQAKAAVAEAAPGDPSIDLDAMALGYARVSRAVRMCILLQARLIEGPQASAGGRKAMERRSLEADEHRETTRGVIEAAIEAEFGEGETAERLRAECAERLDAEPWDRMLERPVEEVLAGICGDLGLNWPLYRSHPWVRCAVQGYDAVERMRNGTFELFWHDRNGRWMSADTFEGAAEWNALHRPSDGPSADSS
jgi:hypothetical protein